MLVLKLLYGEKASNQVKRTDERTGIKAETLTLCHVGVNFTRVGKQMRLPARLIGERGLESHRSLKVFFASAERTRLKRILFDFAL